MIRFNKILIFFSLFALGLFNLDAKSLEFILDHTPQETFTLSNIPEENQGSLDNSFSAHAYCRGVKIANIGDKPIKNCFPAVNRLHCLSLDKLAELLADEKFPLLALYQLWDETIVRDEHIPNDIKCHPLDLLNFKGACTNETFQRQFIALCNALGIETRIANVQGKSCYDFCFDDEWNFLDIGNRQVYLGLNNERIVSSEEVMDDPFLALRAKQGNKTNWHDFKESWKQVARFDILHPCSANPIFIETKELKHRTEGFDLYPGETLTFETPSLNHKLAKQERAIAHVVNLDSRQIPHAWCYRSPVPIRKIVNNSQATIQLTDHKTEIKPGASYTFKKNRPFHVNLKLELGTKGQIIFTSICTKSLFPALVKGRNQIQLGVEINPTIIRCDYDVDESLEQAVISPLHVINHQEVFDYCCPSFQLNSTRDDIETVWWQISSDENFCFVPSNLDQVEPFVSVIALDSISETFLNPKESYYFRIKGYRNGKWSDWSGPYKFSVNKPAAVEEVKFEQVNDNLYELNWERRAEESDTPIEYLIFGSNAIDFIPSIYSSKQINAMENGIVTEEEECDNLKAITKELTLQVTGSLAYYRIIARQHNQLSVPSSIIQVYDQELVQPRNVLQLVEDQNQFVAKRSLFPAAYPWTETSLPHISKKHVHRNSLYKIYTMLRSATKLEKEEKSESEYKYVSPDVSDEVWEEVRPYLLPENHPAWRRLQRVFCKARATQDHDTFRASGFKRWRPGRWSRVSASSHPEFLEYFIKAYCDCELGILYDWKKWIHRIEGAETIRKCIKKYRLQENFKVPHKWIYPLPKYPAPPKTSHYLRKNFILVCENMRILEHDTNEKMYRKKMDHKLLQGLYIIMQVCGLYDSVYYFNCPFCKDGKIAIIDTEYHHKWPVPYHKLSKCFSKEMRPYWDKLTHKGGMIPDGVNRPNPPRWDRRDVRIF